MSYLRFEDQPTGVHVFFVDTMDAGPLGTTATFNETDIATLTRGAKHTVKFLINFVPGPANDVVRIYLDGSLATTGTTWEDYYRYDPEQAGTSNQIPSTGTLEIREGGSTNLPSVLGQGFPLDNFDYASSQASCGSLCYVDTAAGNDSFSGDSPANAKKTIQGGINAVDPNGEVRVLPGTYNESPNITKSLTLDSTAGRSSTLIDLQTGPTYLGSLTIGGNNVTLDGFTIVGRDGTPSQIAASNILVNAGLNNIVIENNKLEVGIIDAGSTNGDDGFGILSTYTTTSADFVNSLNVHDNLFAPLNASGTRSFYVNPGVTAFNFSSNNISGNFEATAIAQATNGLVQNNTVTGSGSSAGLGTWGFPDPDVYGKTRFTGDHISAVANGISVFETNNVTIDHNVITNASTAVRVTDDGDFSAALDPTSVHVNRNSLAVGSSNNGVTADPAFSRSVDGTCNWWGNFSGPGPIAAGSGSKVTTNVNYAPWLQSSNLDSDCSPNGNITIVLDTHPNAPSQPFSFTGTNGIAPFILVDDGTLPSSTKTFNEPAGLYVFRVGTLPKWALIKLTCDTHETILRSHSLLQIQLHSDENVTCTFTESWRAPDEAIALSNVGPYIGDNIYSGTVLPSQTLSQSFAPGETKSFFVHLQNDSLDTDTFRVVSKLKGSLRYHVVFMAGTVEVTGKVNAGTYRFTLAPNAMRTLEIRVTADAALTAGDVRNIILTMQSTTAPNALDKVKAYVTAAP